jgi:hypothetical protein
MTPDMYKASEKEQANQRDAIWGDLLSLPPEETSSKAGASLSYDEKGHPIYSLALFGETYKVDVGGKKIIPPSEDIALFFQELVSLSSYLISSHKGPAPGLSGIEIGPDAIPSGSFFFKGPHALPGAPLAKKYGDHPDKFREMALSWGAIAKTDYPGYKIRALPFAEIHFYLEPRDEEFEAEVRFNFDSNIIHRLPLDGIFALTNELARRLMGERKKLPL